MALTLLRRAGDETLGKLERAARRRFREARKLQAAGEALGAVYLYGYSVEISLKAAYYRTIGLVPANKIHRQLHRRQAEQDIRDMIEAKGALPPRPSGDRIPAGHHILGWARLLEGKRKNPWPPTFKASLDNHANGVFHCWAEFLRYRTTKPSDEELQSVAFAARWFRRNRARLWR
jgi:hypothetical protein